MGHAAVAAALAVAGRTRQQSRRQLERVGGRRRDGGRRAGRRRGAQELTGAYVATGYTCAFVLMMSAGAFAGGRLADRVGRRSCLLFALLPLAAGALVGLGAGLSAGVASMYLSEMAPPARRAPVMALHQLFCTLGILAAQLLGTQPFFGAFDGSGGVNAPLVACRALSSRSRSGSGSLQSPRQKLVQHEALCSQLASGRWGGALVFPLVPLALGGVLGTESPAFVLRRSGDEEALRVLERLRGDAVEASEQLAALHVEAAEATQRGHVGIGQLFAARYRTATIVAIRLQVTSPRNCCSALLHTSN